MNPSSLITEVDGPPTAYFEITDGTNVVRRVYRTLRLSSRELLDDSIDKIRQELLRVTENGEKVTPLIFWRRRPVAAPELHHEGYARLITSPPLSDEFWATVGHDISGTGYTPP